MSKDKNVSTLCSSDKLVSHKPQKAAHFETPGLRSGIGQNTIQVLEHLDQEENLGSKENSFTSVFNFKKLV